MRRVLPLVDDVNYRVGGLGVMVDVRGWLWGGGRYQVTSWGVKMTVRVCICGVCVAVWEEGE